MIVVSRAVFARIIVRTITVIAMMSYVLVIRAQNDGVTPLASTPGAPTGSYALSDLDTINLYNGRVNIRLPLINQAGRGAAKGQMSMSWDTPARWQVFRYTDVNGNPAYYAGLSPFTTAANLHFGSVGISTSGAGQGPQFCDVGAFGYGFSIWNQTLMRMSLVDADGTEHEMRDLATGGQVLPSNVNCWSNTGPSRGRIFVTVDGSGATYIADADIHDGFVVDNEYPSGGGGGGWLLLKDGRRLRSEMRDRNGNLFIEAKDSLNRVIESGASSGTGSQCETLAPGSAFCQFFNTKGFGGAQRQIWITYDMSQRPIYIILPNSRRYHFYYNDYDEVTRIDLPAGGTVEFDYEPGLGGTQYSYGQVQGAIPGTYGGGPNDYHIYRRVTERRVYREGHVLESRQTFSKPESTDGSNLGFVEKKQYDANSVLLNIERHYYFGSANDSFSVGPLAYSGWKEGKEYRTELYDANGNLMRKTENTWEQRAPVYWWTYGSDLAPQNDSRISQTVSYLENGLSSTTTYGYDPTVPYNSVTDVYTYDYNGSLLRHTQTAYLKTLNGVDYSGSNIQSGTSLHMRDFPLQVSVFDGVGVEQSRRTYEYDNYNADAHHAALVARPNISGLDPAYTTSFTTRGNVTGTTRYLFDNGTVVGSVSAYAQYDVAGNVVKTIDALGNPTLLNYDDHFGTPDGETQGNTVPLELSPPGQPVQSSYAYITSATNARGQTVYAQFDFYLGQAVDIEDATGVAGLEDGRGVISSAYFEDLLDRPTRVIQAVNRGAPAKSKTVFSYDDENRTITTTTDLNSYDDHLLKSQTVYDGLGRTIETRTYENSSQYISVKQIPFTVQQDPDTNAWVRTSQSSNPFRPYLGELPVWTTNFMDSLGRTNKVRTPDSAVQRTFYDGARTLAADQMGKERLSLANALGEVRDVWEITPADTETESVSFPGRAEVAAGYHTAYQYDTLSRLIQVTQGGQPPRVFAYDSLGRLRSASNPENGTVNFQYDAGGNLIVKTDARGVSAHYSYDELNRLVRRWYNGSNATTATTQGSPTLPSGVGVTDEVKYFYDTQSLPSGAPSFARGPSTGRTVAITYGTQSAGDYFGYDAAGRMVLKIQQTGGVNYQVTLAHNASGRIKSQVYPSGHTVYYDYDGAGRASNFSGNLGDGTQRNYSTSMIYSALGGLSQEQFGTGTPIYNKLFYNIRGQLSEIREGVTPNNTNWERGAVINFYSSCWGMCAGQPMPDNNGSLKRQEHWVQDGSGNVVAVNAQAFDYDSLNRLTRAYEGSASQPTWQQSYVYDRYGNRRLNVNNTTASLLPKAFELQTNTNRLLAPGDTNLAEANRQMRYDAAGNLTTDNYTGQGQRTYDAENLMTESAGASPATYSYDATGQRVRRNISGTETWQVYGAGGELLAEYPANSPTNPQREYGYRNGQLLVTAGPGAPTAPPPSALGAAPSSGGGNVILNWTAATGANNYRVERKGATGSFALAGTTTSTGLTDTGVSAGSAYLYRVCAATPQGSCTSVFSNIALGAAVSFPTDPTITSSADDPTGVNVTKVKAAHITELRSAVNAVRSLAGLSSGQWTNQTLTATITVISADDVRDLRTKLDEALTVLGIQTSNYDDQTLAGAPNGTIIKKIHITQLRLRATSGIGGSGGGSSTQFGVQWLVVDQLGTPRMVFDESGSLANVRRHDYLPFGEELLAGNRATTPGYAVADGVRQKFTLKERDTETGLDYFLARYYSSIQGRFTSADSFGGRTGNPQTFNLYSYVLNNPLQYVDPTGHVPEDPVPQLRPEEIKKLHDEAIANDGMVVETTTKQKKDTEVRDDQPSSPAPSMWDLPSPLNMPMRLCPTGLCDKGRTLADDRNTAVAVFNEGREVMNTVWDSSDSLDVNVSLFWVINGGAHLTRDGDVFPDFTPPQSGLVQLIVAGAKNAIIHPVPFSFSVTSTHIFYGSQPHNMETRRSFFGGGSISAGGAIPLIRGTGPYLGGVYSPSSRLFASQVGWGSGGVGGGYTMSPNKPIFTFPFMRDLPRRPF